MASWASILQQVGTPLQLAALFLLLASAVTRGLAKSGKWRSSPAITQSIINRVFAAAIIALVLGIGASLVAPLLSRVGGDQDFHGVVLSTVGEPVPLATVDLIPIGEWTTNALGQFNPTLSSSQRRKEYKLQIKADNFESAELTETDAEMLSGVEIRLKPVPPELIKELDSKLFIAQIFGMPVVVPNLRLRNSDKITVWINEISGRLSSSESSFTLQPMTWTINNPFNWFAPVTGNFPIPAGMDLDLRIGMISTANYASMINKINSLPEYSTQQPCLQKANGSMDPLSEDAYEMLNTYATKHFAWKEGVWHYQMTVKWGQQTRSFDRDFTLSGSDVERLRASVALARQCMGVNWLLPLVQDGDLANFIVK
jgi:hypothetical protein